MTRVLALDLGTTSVRAEVFSSDGSVLGHARRALGVELPAADRVEQSATEFAEASVAVIREALARAESGADEIDALGIVAQRGSAVAWDAASGEALAPVIGWQDRRTRARVEELRAMGAPATTQAACTKFEWLLTDARVRAAADAGTLRMGTPDAWITWVLSGGSAHVTDPSNAGATGLHFAGTDDWNDDVLGLFGQERAWHPEIVATDAVVGMTSASVLGAEIPLAARAGDQQAACFAQGVREDGDGKLTLGTAAMLDRCTGDRVADAPAGTYALPLWRRVGKGDVHCIEGSVITAGAAIEWLVRLGLLASPAALDATLADARSASEVCFLPALAGLGTPWMRDDARGRFTGLGVETSAADLVLAVVDGIAQRVAELADAVDVSPPPRSDASPISAVRLAVDGGLTASAALLQRIADLSGLALAVARDAEATARGAAALAAAAPELGLTPIAPPEAATIVEPLMSAGERAERRGRWRERCASVDTA